MFTSTIDRSAPGACVLVVEDEYFLAQDLLRALADNGAAIVGPVGTVEAARDALASCTVDCAILDINLRGDSCYEIAALLRKCAIPFVFATGYEAATIDPAFQDVPVYQKPFESADVARYVMAMR